jgi:hypothetical protein
MKNPDWYPDWRHDAVHQLQEKNARLNAEFRLSEWPRYDYDFDAGQLVFSEQGLAKVIADIQIAGSTSANAGNWLWAWANLHLPQELVTASVSLRAFGEEHGIDEMTRPNVSGDDLNALGWELTAVSVRVSNAIGAYRPPRAEGGGIYLIYKSMSWAN